MPSTSRSRTSSRSASRAGSRCASTACSTRLRRTSRWRRRSGRRSTPSASGTRGSRGSRPPSSRGPPERLIATTHERAQSTGGLAPAFAVARTRLGLIALLLALAAVGWWWTLDQMHGRDGGPGTGLGALAWFAGIWVAMMAAMMFPSVAPTVALYSRMTKSRSPIAPLLFTSGYLVAWTSVGVSAFAVATAGGRISGDLLAWDRAGRWVAGATLIVAAVYELTPLKDVCLGKCRSPLGFLLGSWRNGRAGALKMGARQGAWCIGCCWALMASLFALGVMSIVWMAVVAGLIAFEKLIPSRRTATYATAGILLVFGVLLLAAPDTIPLLTIPGSGPMSPTNQ